MVGRTAQVVHGFSLFYKLENKTATTAKTTHLGILDDYIAPVAH